MDLQKITRFFKNITLSSAYNLTRKQYDYLCFLLQSVHVYWLDATLAPMNISFKEKTGRTVFQKSVKCCPQVIDAVPICENGMLQYVCPVMILGDSMFWGGNQVDEVWVTIHEFCHLLSIGPYVLCESAKIERKQWRHTYGINEYTYEIDAGYLRTRNFNGSIRINEWVNEYVTGHFAYLMNVQRSISRRSQKYFNEFVLQTCASADIGQAEFIGLYFSGRTRDIKNILLSDRFINYDELEKYILKKMQNEERITNLWAAQNFCQLSTRTERGGQHDD